MSILVVYAAQPRFPATDQDPTAARVKIGSLWVDYTGAQPDQAALDAFFAPSAEQTRTAAIRANARRTALVTAIQNNDDAGLIAAVAARYPALSGDAIKAVTDLALLAAAVIRT